MTGRSVFAEKLSATGHRSGVLFARQRKSLRVIKKIEGQRREEAGGAKEARNQRFTLKKKKRGRVEEGGWRPGQARRQWKESNDCIESKLYNGW